MQRNASAELPLCEGGGEGGDDGFGGFAAEGEAEEVGGEAAGSEFGAALGGCYEVVVGEVDEGADERGLHAKARAFGQGEAVVETGEVAAEAEA